MIDLSKIRSLTPRPARPRRKITACVHEVSERHGDYAIVAVAAQLTFDGATCTNASVAFGGVDDIPVRIPAFESGLIGQMLADGVPDTVLDLVPERMNPGSDQHASADYRRRVARTLAGRAVIAAVADAQGEQ